jgi:hypothetical protein
MEQFIAFFRDLLIRLSAKSPKFFNILKWISSGIVVFIGLGLSLNELYDFGWGLIMAFGKIPLTQLLIMIGAFLTGIFTVAQLTISDKSVKKEDLTLKEPEPKTGM